MAQVRRITRSGKSFCVIDGRNGEFWEAVSKGEWEPETYAIFDRFIEAGSSYIDMGSWIGPTLLYGSQLAKAAYGIEPDPIAYAELSEKVACNRPVTENVRLFNGASRRDRARSPSAAATRAAIRRRASSSAGGR